MGKATPEYNLAVIHPKVSKEWHPTKNKPLTLDVITSGSRKKVWWKCKKNHKWEAIVKDRARGSGCPECSGRFPTKTNNLYVKFSEVAGEWHPTKNKNLTPKDVTPGSDKKVWWKCEKVHEWIARVGERSRGSGCPYCSGRYPTKTNNLYVKFPEVAKAWHPTKNKPLTAKDVTSRSNQKVWWKCTKDHEWDATIASRSGGNNCPECSGKKAGKDNNLQFKFPKVAKEWHSTKNIPLTSKDVTSGSAKKVWWQCNKGHEWEATIKRRALRVDGCPECSGKKAGKDNNLQLLHAKVAKEWHPTKNKSLTSKDVTPGSAKKVWWQCNKGHEWESVVQSRVTGGRNNKYLGCPLCSGRIPHREHNLHIKHPDVAKEWHPTKNTPLTSKDVTPRSNKKVWWKCKKSHEWEAIVQGRSKGNGCPYCSGRFPTKTNNLYVKFSEVAKEWHLTKNKTLTPKDVTPGSGKKVWWKCKKGHEWAAIISNRSQGTGCPLCRPNISKIQIQVFCELKTIFKEIFLGKRIDKIECDIYLSKYKIAIEYDGYHWHKGNEKKDRKKNLELNKKGVALFRIRERQLKKISLNEIKITINNSTSPKITNEKKADNTRNLSANGSKNTPIRVSYPYFRAILPSNASVIDAIVNIIAEINFAWS